MTVTELLQLLLNEPPTAKIGVMFKGEQEEYEIDGIAGSGDEVWICIEEPE